MNENFDIIQKTEKERLFEQVETPQELYDFMTRNIKYGFVGEDQEIYSPEKEGWGVGEQPEIKIQSPREMINSGYGMCWEQTDLARSWFSSHDFDNQSYIISFGKNASQKTPAHSFLAFREGNQWSLFETSLGIKNGIYKFDSLEELIQKAEKNVFDNALYSGATEDDIQKYRLVEFGQLKYGGNAKEYLNNLT